ncbi:MAG: hypothetical protein DPW09_15195 [Anaerolineae bacterium]|nr:BMP family ABC transporter substrate-binding protein [Anaerolineales bacterium]MCQ3974786.1 hypothetical protein [Anaerolineae bacterium]
MKKQIFWLSALLIAITIVLAACTGAQPAAPAEEPAADAPATEAPGAAEEPATTEEPAAAEEATEAPEAAAPTDGCTDAIGCVEIAAGDPIHIAWIQTVSGATAPLGTDNVRAVEIAVADKGGELLGHPIELTGEDSLCSAEGGQTAGTKIAADPTVVGVIGTTCSSEARAAMGLLAEAGLVMLSSSNTNPDLTNPEHPDHHPGYLRTAHNDLFQGRVAAEFAYNELGVRSAATIHDGGPYAESLQAVFAQVFTELGGSITSQEAINVGDTDMKAVLTKIGADKPELIYLPIFEPEGDFVAAQKCDVQDLAETYLMGADGLLADTVPEAIGECGNGMFISGPFVKGQAYDDFVAKYTETYGEAPVSGYHAHAYDATNILFAAIEQVAVQNEDGSLSIGRQALRDALYGTKDYKGLTGNLGCDENGDCATGEALAIFQLTEAEIVDGNWPPQPYWLPGQGTVAEAAEPAESEAPAEAPAEAEAMAVDIEPIRIAIIMPSTISDYAWSQSMFDSLKAIQAAAGEDVVEIAYTENMFNVTDAAAAIRDYADNGYNLIIAHGAQYGASLFEIAPDFPETSFAWGTTTNTGAEEGVTNVFAYEPRGDEGGYVSGVLAAKLTTAKVIGLVGPVDAGDAKLHVDGFLAGVKATDPEVQVNVSFTGSFGDTALAAEAANVQVNAGADVLTGSSQQVVGAIGVAKEKGIPWIGIQADQSPVAPDVVVATALYDWQNLVLEMIKSHQAGELGGKVLQLTFANGGIKMIYDDSLPAEAVEAAQAAEAGLIDGSIEIVAEPR